MFVFSKIIFSLNLVVYLVWYGFLISIAIICGITDHKVLIGKIHFNSFGNEPVLKQINEEPKPINFKAVAFAKNGRRLKSLDSDVKYTQIGKQARITKLATMKGDFSPFKSWNRQVSFVSDDNCDFSPVKMVRIHSIEQYNICYFWMLSALSLIYLTKICQMWQLLCFIKKL